MVLIWCVVFFSGYVGSLVLVESYGLGRACSKECST
jgi:hypothetical protein